MALRALESHTLLPISEMGHLRDKDKPGAHYVYFRVMRSGETSGNMAFNSVGSAIIAYKTRMAFQTSIWTRSTGGYVSSFDRQGRINATPYDQAKQRQTFHAILSLGRTARGNAEVGIRGSVSMGDLQSIWCLFPYPLDKLVERKKEEESSHLPSLRVPSKASRRVVAPAALRPGAAGARIRSRRPKPVSTVKVEGPLSCARSYYKKLAAYLPYTDKGGSVSGGAQTYYWITFSRNP